MESADKGEQVVHHDRLKPHAPRDPQQYDTSWVKDVRLRYEHIRKRERRAQSEKTTDEATASESELEECLVPDAW